MSVSQTQRSAPCRFTVQHPTIGRPASRFPLVRGRTYDRVGMLCASTRRGLRASSRPRLRDSRRLAARNAPPRRSS